MDEELSIMKERMLSRLDTRIGELYHMWKKIGKCARVCTSSFRFDRSLVLKPNVFFPFLCRLRERGAAEAESSSFGAN